MLVLVLKILMTLQYSLIAIFQGRFLFKSIIYTENDRKKGQKEFLADFVRKNLFGDNFAWLG